VNETDAAIVELEAALKLSPDSPQLHYNLGAAYKIEDDAAHAIPELETARSWMHLRMSRSIFGRALYAAGSL